MTDNTTHLAKVRQAIEAELAKLMEYDPDFDGFGVDTPETNRLAQAAINALQLHESRQTLFTGTLVSWSTTPVFEPATKL